MFEKTIFELNWTMPIFVVMFLVFMKALNAVFLQPVGAVIARREKRIKDDITAGQSARQQATELIEGYEKDLREVRFKAQTLINDATGAVQKQRTADLKVIQEQGVAKVAEAKRTIDAERAELTDKLVDEERGLVEVIVQKLLGSNVSITLDSANIKHALEESR